MRKLKACLLLLVMLLLPVRGAMAGMGLLCQHVPQPAQTVAQHAAHAHDQHAVQQGANGVRDPGEFAHHDHGDRSAADSCNLCVSVCSTPPLAFVAVRVPAPPNEGELVFPPVDLARLSYLTGALDRPPRTA
jgi:hypothetical protein